MRLLMLGWEFPPFISGGLGTACYGLVCAMERLKMETLFVLPMAVERVNPALCEIERRGMEEAASVIAVSHLTKRTLVERYGVAPEKVRVIHNGIEPKASSPLTPAIPVGGVGRQCWPPSIAAVHICNGSVYTMNSSRTSRWRRSLGKLRQATSCSRLPKDARVAQVAESCHSPIFCRPRLSVLVGGIGLESLFLVYRRRS